MMLIFLCALAWQCSWCFALTNSNINEETDLSVFLKLFKYCQKDIVEKYGYPFETFADVSTEDGYLLDIYRISHGLNDTYDSSRPPVLMVHGLTGSARNYIALGPERGLAFYLADHGYDVWLLNCRGTVASRKHATLNPDSYKYWDFSWHEIGYYDLPASFDLILNVTNHTSVSYIGHSQGTTVFYVFASERVEYNENVAIAIMLAPQVYMQNFRSRPTKILAFFEPLGRKILELANIGEFPPKTFAKPLIKFLQLTCRTPGVLQEFCASLFYLQGGYNPSQLDKNVLSDLVVDFPTISTRQALHYGQNINSGQFKKYDYDALTNMQMYGTIEPPAYNLTKITAPMALYYGDSDLFINPENLDRACREVQKCVYEYKVPYEGFTHFDFLYAIDVVSLVHVDVVKTLNKYNNVL